MKLWRAVTKRVADEPARTMGVIQAGIALAVGFGLDWTGEQVALVTAFSGALLSWLVRRAVTPVANPRLPAPDVLPGYEPPD